MVKTLSTSGLHIIKQNTLDFGTFDYLFLDGGIIQDYACKRGLKIHTKQEFTNYSEL